jgi:hypothetical protein
MILNTYLVYIFLNVGIGWMNSIKIGIGFAQWSQSAKPTYLKRLYIIILISIVNYQDFVNAMHVFFRVYRTKWIVVNVRHVNNCVKM